MKERTFRMLRSGLAMLLALCMVVGFVPTAVFAVEVKDGNGDGIINYVSFGASNTNGYGLSGYMPAGTTAINKDTANVYGYQRLPAESYPYLVAAALNEAAGGAVSSAPYDGTAANDPFEKVHVDQLAMSSMRMEDLRFLLDDTYPGDKYTDWRFYELGLDDRMSQNWFAKAEADLDALRAVYVKAIEEADVITLDMGVNNFGVFMNRAMDGSVDLDLNAIDPEIAAQYAQAKAFVKQTVAQYSGEAALLLDGMNQMIDALAFTLVGFCTSFDVVMGKIQELNPDATVVVVSIQNLLTDMSLEMPGFEQTLPLGEIFGAVINAANLYTAGRSPYRDNYLYSDVRKSGRVRFFVDDMREYNGDPSTITQNMKDSFNIYGDELWDSTRTKDLEDQVLEMVDGFLASKIQAAFDSAELGILVGIYGSDVLNGFLADGANGFAYASAALSGVLADNEVAVATKKYEEVYKNYVQMKAMYQPLALDMAYDVLHELFRECVEDTTINFAAMALDGAAQGAIENILLGSIVDEAVGAIEQLAVDPTYTYDINSKYPDGFLETKVAEYNAANDPDLPLSIVKTVACMGVRTGLANSFYGHPTPYGHKQIANAILKTMEEDITGDDVVEEEVKIVLSELYDLIQKYGPEVAEQVWQQWVDAGYVADVEATINELLATLETRYEYYTTEALPAIDASVLELVAQKDALLVELDALKVELAAKKAELEDVISKQEISDIYAPDINIDVELGDNEQTTVPENECVVESATIKGELEAAIRDIEHAIATIEALIADIEADVADMVALAEQIAAAVAELEKHMESIAVAAKDLNAAVLAVAEVLENSNGVVDSVLKSFDAARETVLAASKVLDLAMGVANEMIADIDGMIAKVAADAEALYNKVVADLPAALAQMPEEMVMAIGIALYASQYVDVAAIDLALQAKAAEYGITEETLTEEYIMAEIAKIAAEYGVTDETVLAKYNEITGKIDAHITEKYAQIEADTKAQIAALEAEATEKIATLELELEGYKAQLAELAEDAAEEVKAGIQAQIDRVTADIATVNADLEHAVAHLNNAAEMAYQQIVAEAMKLYENAKAAVEAEIAALEEQLKAMIPDLEATVEGIKAAVEAAKATIEEILNANIESIEDLMNTLVALGAEEAAKLVQSVVDQINAIFKKATSSDLVLHDDFKYVAIGDGSAAPESYVEKLAAELNVEAASKGYNEISYVNKAKAGNTVAAERANLSDVTGADLITVGFSNVNFLYEALTKATAGAEIDWSNYVGEENVEYVDELLAEVDAKLAEGIEDAATRAYVMNIAEAYAYSAVEYAVELPALINEINAVNSDALVIIVGMYNPLENVTIALDETTTLDIGEYVDYLVKGVAVHGIAYSVLTGNAIYVDAPAVETAVSGKTLGLMDLMGLLMNNFAGMYPTEAGHEYIKNQILNALDLDTDMLGDADGNGKITTNDAKLVLQYVVKLIGADDLNLKVCDVDGNGSITTNDAKLILQYVVELINKFPAEA